MTDDVLSGFHLEAQRALALAQRKARIRRHRHVEPEHLMSALLELPESKAPEMLEKAGVRRTALNASLDVRLKTLAAGFGSVPRLGSRLLSLLPRALDEARAQGSSRAATEHLLLAVAAEGAVSEMLRELGVDRARLIEALTGLVSGSGVRRGDVRRGADEGAARASASSGGDEPPPDAGMLALYSTDITALAESGALDPVVGRQQVLRRVIQILCRRSKNNPVLLGEPGVGKTAITEGLAQMLAAGEVPKPLVGVRILRLDLGALLAGAKFRGEFEERLRAVMDQVRASRGSILLFIDELHTLVGAGQSGGGGLDAANLLKPALARGELRCIGATTPEEYRLYLERDRALERRFQPVRVEEPDDAQALAILRGLKPRYELYHGVRFSDEALEAAVRLSRRYIADRALPDKAIDLLDEAASRLRVELDSEPDELAALDSERARVKLILESVSGSDAKAQQADRLETQLEELDSARARMVGQWQAELELLEKAQAIRTELRESEDALGRATAAAELEEAARLQHGRIPELMSQLKEVEAKLENPDLEPRLLSDRVGPHEVAEVVATWTSIPVNEMLGSERERLKQMEEILSRRVKGQPDPVRLVSAAVRRARVGLSDPGRPIGSFLFLGPTGVGKTELAKALAEFLFHREDAMVRLDMSEYMEKAAANRLVGAPPGYVGFESGGQLTEAVRQRPYSVVLFDEMEKAHPEVFDMLLQVLDDGRLTDGWGRTVDMSNTVIVMTSNVAARSILEHAGRQEAIQKTVMDELHAHYRPEFLNRIDEVVVFNPLEKEHVRQIATLMVDELALRLAERGFSLSMPDAALDELAEAGWDPAFGARPLRRAIQRMLSDPLAVYLLDHAVLPGSVIEAEFRDGSLHVEVRSPTPDDDGPRPRDED